VGGELSTYGGEERSVKEPEVNRPFGRTRDRWENNMIYLLTAIGLTPGGSSTVHIYTQTIHRTTQLTARTTQLDGPLGSGLGS
jgi:hypothetical protein